MEPAKQIISLTVMGYQRLSKDKNNTVIIELKKLLYSNFMLFF